MLLKAGAEDCRTKGERVADDGAGVVASEQRENDSLDWLHEYLSYWYRFTSA
jgi:hypothetical protein